MRIHTVLCPIDFSGLDDVEIGLAAEVCRAFGATLLLHHNLAAAEPGFSRAWEWTKAHEGHLDAIPEAERRVQAVLDRVAGRVPAEAAITSGPVGSAILTLAQEMPADLVVLGSHGWSTQDHSSVTERLVDQSPCPVLTFQEGVADTHAFRLGGEPRRVVVATDLSHDARSAVAYACAMARVLPIELDLLHVIRDKPDDAAVAHAHAALDGQVPSDLVERVTAHVRVGPAAETIVAYVEETKPAFVVIGEHAHGLIRRLLTHDTTREVVHELQCPVWVVPPGMEV